MTLSRRRMLRAAAGIAAAPILCAIAKAQGYPSRPVRFVVPFPPGGVSDIIARLIGQKLSERLGQPFVIEDRGGAGSNLGTEIVVRAPADGHTLLLDGSAIMRSTPRSTRISASTTFAILRRWQACSARRISWRSTHPFRRRRLRNSSLTPRLTPAGSTWRRPAPGRYPIWLANCSP